MSHPTIHRTPLRRVSRGSLAAISRSGNFPDAPANLGFIGPALETFTEEVEALHANLEGLNALAASLQTFNESFASYLYVQKMNAYCVEWPQAPVEASFVLAKERAEASAEAALTAAHNIPRTLTPASDPPRSATATSIADKTVPGEATFALSEADDIPNPTKPKPKKKVKTKMTAKEKKERGQILEKVCTVLPLEFRGGDPVLRRQVEHVIESLMDAEGGLRITDMVRNDINQAKVNKCLIALLARKVIQKQSNPGGVIYTWQGVP